LLICLELARRVAARVDELVVMTADAPDLPGLVLAKIFRVLHRVDLVVAAAQRRWLRGHRRRLGVAGLVDR
jgi:hypothetical protein